MVGPVITGVGLPGKCPCEGLEGWRLVECLAPPRGEYEVSYEVGRGVVVSISRDGLFMRQLKSPGYLPYLASIERKVDPEAVERMGITPERALCDVAEALEQASRHGSEVAALTLSECRALLERIREACRDRSPTAPHRVGAQGAPPRPRGPC